jgi:deoxyribodipyrimidine photo-lyase
MQSGVTGINLPRIYSVFKQSLDQDSTAEWTKKMIPQLENVEIKLIHNAELKDIYFDQIVDPKLSAKKARDTVWAMRKNSDFKKIAREVYLKHGSRKKQHFNRVSN